MRFGRRLQEAIYPPWKDKYIDYAKLKSILRENQPDDDEWTDEDEKRFCDEIFNVQLEKVAQFQQEQFNSLRQRVDAAFEQLKSLTPQDAPAPAPAPAPAEQPAGEPSSSAPKPQVPAAKLKELEAELDSITRDVRELKRFSSINYTGFLKIVKKHDRKRGGRYRVRPTMRLSLSQRPFNSEQGYSPLLNKLSIMYFAIRQQLEEGDAPAPLDLESQGETRNGERYTAHRFWVHPENLLEVKTLILRHLPSLVYSDHTSKEADGNDSPAVTSLYFDNKDFEIYSEKVDRQSEASSLRLRWYSQLSARPEIYVERKTVDSAGNSREDKFTIKDKWVKPFLDGEYAMEKSTQKMKRQSLPADQIQSFQETSQSIQAFVREKKLEPVMRANYVRTAFQKPTDSRIRILIDTDLAFIREDALDANRPCRDPGEWHRTDIDNSGMTYPFANINQSEVAKFPYAVLELRIKEDGSRHHHPKWVQNLMSSHLVHPVPRFSKFVHGVASLFEDYVNNLPFWLSDLEKDIRKDPQEAFEEEEQRRAQRADDVMAVGSLIGAKSGSYKMSKSSPVGRSYLSERMAADQAAARQQHRLKEPGGGAGEEEGEASGSGARDGAGGGGGGGAGNGAQGYGGLSSVMPSFSLSKYAMAKRDNQQNVHLPEGVEEPSKWIKNTGELKIEPKVWLANERTFLKWQHICILQGSLAVGLYTAAGESVLAEVMGIIYILIAVFAGLWGYSMLQTRRAMIMERSGKDFDNMLGPIVISVAMMAALILNFIFQYKAAAKRWSDARGEQLVVVGDGLDEL